MFRTKIYKLHAAQYHKVNNLSNEKYSLDSFGFENFGFLTSTFVFFCNFVLILEHTSPRKKVRVSGPFS